MKSKIQLVSFVTIVDVDERLPEFEQRKLPKKEHFGDQDCVISDDRSQLLTKRSQ